MKKVHSLIKSLLCRGDDNVSIDKGAHVFPKASLKVTRGGSIKVGKALINDNAFVCASGGIIEISDDVTINRNSIIVAKSKVIVGRGSSIGPNVCIYDHNHKIDKGGFYKDKFVTTPIVIGQNVWIAANCTILKGTIIGDNCIIGAGCVVAGEIPSNTLVKTDISLLYTPLHD